MAQNNAINNSTSALTITPFAEGALVTSSTGVVSTVTGTAGNVLTANAAGTAPTFQAAGGGGGITTINGDTGSVTGATVTFNANSQAGKTVTLSGSGTTMSFNVTDGNNQTAIGLFALNAGGNANNTALGQQALQSATGSSNTALGSTALRQLTTGNFNIGIGVSSGAAYTGSESSNIIISGASDPSVNGESHVLRIGNGTGSGVGNLNKAFISGIDGITVTGTAVLVSSSDQLGVAVSSRRYKENIEDMADVSSDILKLRPVTFTLKDHEDQSTQFGLIAEEVNEIMPDLIVYDKQGDPQTVQYHELPALLLNELQKAVKRIDELEDQLRRRNVI